MSDKDVTNADQLRAMIWEMLNEEDKAFTDREINFLDLMYKRFNLPFTKEQVKEINKIYDTRM